MQAVHFTVDVNPTTVFAGEPITVTVGIRDQLNNIVPQYRGTIVFTSTSSFTGLPAGGLGGWRYTFTGDDAGQHSFTNVMLYQAGQHRLGVSDNYRQTSSNPVTVSDVFFRASFTPDHAYINDPTLSLTIEVLNEQGQRVSRYRGSIDLNPSVEIRGLPQSSFQATPDFTFTATDQGWRTFDHLAFTLGGSQTLIMTDRNNPERTSTSNSVSVSIPPDPTPIPGDAMPSAPQLISYTQLIALPPLPPPMEYSWVKPYRAQLAYTGPNWWGGFPSKAIPARPGAFAITTGVSQRGPFEWWAGTFYICAFTGWEATLTSNRLTGPSLQVPWADPTFDSPAEGSYGGSCYSELLNGCALT